MEEKMDEIKSDIVSENQKKERPFEEVVVDIIGATFCDYFEYLAGIIKAVEITFNHDRLLRAWQYKTEAYCCSDFGVTESVLGQKTFNYAEKMNSAETLEKAIELGFCVLPLGIEFLGPKGKLLLLRNSILLGHDYSAEIIVQNMEDDKKIIFGAYWGASDKQFNLVASSEEKIEDWSTKW